MIRQEYLPPLRTRNLAKVLHGYEMTECFVQIHRQAYVEASAQLQVPRQMVERRETTDCVLQHDSENENLVAEEVSDGFEAHDGTSIGELTYDGSSDDSEHQEMNEPDRNQHEQPINMEWQEIGAEVELTMEPPADDDRTMDKENNESSFMKYYKQNQHLLNAGGKKSDTSSFRKFLAEKRDN